MHSSNIYWHIQEEYSCWKIVKRKKIFKMVNSGSYAMSWLSSIVMAIVLLLLVASEEHEPGTEVVELDVGKLRGSVFTTSKGRKVLAYLGIPYAKPPINDLRFMPPQPSDGWHGIKNATSDASVCPQVHVLTGEYVGDEDCLYLNVFTPKIIRIDKEDKLPVMVWIHGGLFIAGSGTTDWFGPQYFLDEDIIFVAINYRLGALGFLSTEDKAATGNNGLKDQVMALKWVKDYISKFGGDPRRITIFGNDAGAASVHYHILSPMSKGLFHRGISQSGSALNPWALTFKARTMAWNLAELLSCDLDANSFNMVTCLKGQPADRIVTATQRMKEPESTLFSPFVPVLEKKGGDVFLSTDPMKIMNDGKANKVKYILGVNSHEGILTSAQVLNDADLWFAMKYEFERFLPKYFGYDEESAKSKEIVKNIKEFYFANKTITSALYGKFYEMEMDHKYLSGMFKTAKLLVQGIFPKIWFYHFSYDGGIEFPNAELKNDVKGVNHGEELIYMFKSTLFPIELKAGTSQAKISEKIIKMWTNFAADGNPVPEQTELLNSPWDPFSLKNKTYLDIGAEMKMEEKLYADRMETWDTIYKILLRKERMRDEL